MENFVNMGRQFLNNQSGEQQQGAPQQGGGNNQGMFGQMAGMLHKQDNGQPDTNVDENQLMSAFNKVMNNGSSNSQEIGQAAAVNAIKSELGQGGQPQGGVDGLVGKAMAFASSQASKNGGNQQDAMNHASETVMKLMLKHKMKSMLGGGGGGMGDASQLLSLLK